MTTVVSTLGLSGVELMSNMWRYPMVQMNGGHIVISSRGTRGVIPWNNFSLFSLSQVRETVRDLYPEAEVTATLLVPVQYGGDVEYIAGRSGGLDKWYLMSPLASGTGLSQNNLNDAVFVARQQDVAALAIATLETNGDLQTWQLVGAPRASLRPIGTSAFPYHIGVAIGHLSAVQSLSNTPEDLVHIVGIALPGLHARLDGRYEELKTRLADRVPGVSVSSVDQFFEEEFGELQQLRQAAALYTPILLLIGLQVIIATALAVAHTRRRELTLLRIIGFSYRQLWLLLTLESTLSALTACGIGLLLGKLVAFFAFRSSAISLLPFALALIASIIVSMVVGILTVTRSVPSVMRNS